MRTGSAYERKVTGLRLMLQPPDQKPGQTAVLTAQLLFNGDDYPDKANVDVDLTAPEDGGVVFLDPMEGEDQDGEKRVTLQTDAQGRGTTPEGRFKATLALGASGENAKPDECEELREDARKSCAGLENDCEPGLTCEEQKELRKSLIVCQKARREVMDRCKSPEADEEYEKIKKRVELCGGLIARDCCPDWTKDLDEKKNDVCKASACNGTDDCSTLLFKLASARECLRLRELQTRMCFDGDADVGHEIQEDQVMRMIGNCAEIIREYNASHLGRECLKSVSELPGL